MDFGNIKLASDRLAERSGRLPAMGDLCGEPGGTPRTTCSRPGAAVSPRLEDNPAALRRSRLTPAPGTIWRPDPPACWRTGILASSPCRRPATDPVCDDASVAGRSSSPHADGRPAAEPAADVPAAGRRACQRAQPVALGHRPDRSLRRAARPEGSLPGRPSSSCSARSWTGSEMRITRRRQREPHAPVDRCPARRMGVVLPGDQVAVSTGRPKMTGGRGGRRRPGRQHQALGAAARAAFARRRHLLDHRGKAAMKLR